MASITDLVSSAAVTPNEGATGCYVRLAHQVSPSEYQQFKAVAEMAGGRYVNKDRGHLFALTQDKVLPALTSAAERIVQNKKLNDKDFFPTPEHAADEAVVNMAAQHGECEFSACLQDEAYRILEPSAGDGALIDALYRYAEKHDIPVQCQIVLAELDPLRCDTLRAKYAHHANISVVEGDFLSLSPDDLGEFNACLMNPPFTSSGGWDTHIQHAQRFMSTSGHYNAIMSCVLPSLTGIALGSKRGSKQDMALDMMALCAAGGYGIHQALDVNAFLNHAQRRGTAIKTGTSCDLVCFEALPDAIPPRVALDIFEKALVVLENTSSFYNRMSAIFKAHSSDPMQCLEETKKILRENRGDLIVAQGVGLHSSVDQEALAANMVLSVFETYEKDIPQEAKKVLLDAAKRPEMAVRAAQEMERAKEQKDAPDVRRATPVTNAFDF